MWVIKLIKYGGFIFGIKAILDKLNIILTKILYRCKFFKKSVQYSAVDFLIRNRKNLQVSIHNRHIHIVDSKSQNELFLRKDTSDIAVYMEIFEQDEYASLINEIKERKIPVNTILDVGSNIGLSVVYFLNEFPDAKVIALEPDSSNYEQLLSNIKLNKLSNVIPVRAGLWLHDTKLKIDTNFRGGSHWSLTVIEDQDGDIDGISVTTIIRENEIKEIDLLKIDIEGAEHLLFKDSKKCDYLNNVRSICIEIHEEVNSFAPVANTLANYGFKLDFKNDVLFGFKE